MTARRITATAAAAALTLALAAACADDEPASDPRPGTAVPAPTDTDEPAPDTDRTIDFDAGEEVITGANVPWGLAFGPDGDAYLAERDTARILHITPDGDHYAVEPVHDVPDADTASEGGLLGLALHPDDPRLLYAYYTSPDDNRVIRIDLDADTEPDVIIDGIPKASFHNGGRIAFGPDGMLYTATGDAGRTETAQDPASLGGKILRTTPDGDPAPGNPDPDSPVYSLGHRNVQGIAWDHEGRMWASEFGQNDVDEINRIEPGANYGWPDVEGEGDTDGGRFTNPEHTWPVSEASPSGISVAHGTVYMAALRGERLWAMDITDDGTLDDPTDMFEGDHGRLRTVATAPDGSLWLTTSNTDGRGNVRDGDDRIIRFPAADA